MSQFACVDIPKFSQKDGDKALATCVCCLTKDFSLINITNCRHAFVLEKITNFMVYIPTVCHECHGFLEKIDLFIQKVVKCQKILSAQLGQKQPENTFKLEIRDTTDEDAASASALSQTEVGVKTELVVEIEPVVKTEPVSDEDCMIDSCPSVDTSLIFHEGENQNGDYSDKMAATENEVSDSDSEKPLASLKTSVDKEDKIKVIKLTEEEMREERLRDSQREEFVKFRYKCNSCIVGFVYQQMFDNHMRKHEEKKHGVRCEICLSVFSSKESYTTHHKRHFIRYECGLCGKRYIYRNTAQWHQTTSHAIGTAAVLKCDQCDYLTISNRRLSYHLNKHKFKAQCKICERKLVNKNALKVHMLTVHRQSSTEFRCEPCGKLYRARSGLIEHNKAYHAKEPESFYCAECNLYFKTDKNLRKHFKDHARHRTGESFQCTECPAKFVLAASLRRHEEFVHYGTVHFDCTQCSKTFARKRDLNRHVEYVHEKKRPPKNKICDYCGRGFTTFQVLRTHIRTHTRERPLRCEQCSATFAHPGALYTHGKIHAK